MRERRGGVAKYPKPKPTKTMKQGLRPYSAGSRDTFPPSMVERMEARVEKVLADSRVPSSEELWLLTHLLLVACFRRASLEARSQIKLAIDRHEKEGHELGFSIPEVQGLNRVVLQIDQQGQLESFVQRVKEAQMRQV
jgi:hypothetical protein